ncbi:MAG: hypothetical protein ACQEVA_01625 [Myxococcota bacterium]
MISRTIGILATFLLTTLISTSAFAQSAERGEPFSPQRYEVSQLIHFGEFDESPLMFDWEVAKTSRVPTKGGADFELVLVPSYTEVKRDIEDRYDNKKPIATLKDNMVPMVSHRELQATGRVDQDNLTRYTLGSMKTTHRFVVELMNRGGQAVIIVKNSAHARRFGGVIPPFEPFKAFGADQVAID